MRRASMFVVAGLAVVVAGCGSSSNSSSSSSSAATPSPSSSSSSSSAAPAPATGGAGSSVHLSADPSKLAFDTQKLTAKAGKVTLVMANPASFSHGIGVKGNGVDKDGNIVGHGGTSTVSVTLKPGTYEFYCPVPGHEAAGMKGTLTVT